MVGMNQYCSEPTRVLLTVPSSAGSVARTIAVKNSDMIFGGLVGSGLKM